jgi:hypothetical protein
MVLKMKMLAINNSISNLKVKRFKTPNAAYSNRWQQSHRSESQQFRNAKGIWLTNLDSAKQIRF